MSTALPKLMDTVESAKAPYVADDFVADSFALYALALSKLPERERGANYAELKTASCGVRSSYSKRGARHHIRERSRRKDT
jgi:hypothetical protein